MKTAWVLKKFLDKKILQLERIADKDLRRRLLNIIVNRATRFVWAVARVFVSCLYGEINLRGKTFRSLFSRAKNCEVEFTSTGWTMYWCTEILQKPHACAETLEGTCKYYCITCHPLQYRCPWTPASVWWMPKWGYWEYTLKPNCKGDTVPNRSRDGKSTMVSLCIQQPFQRRQSKLPPLDYWSVSSNSRINPADHITLQYNYVIKTWQYTSEL